MAENTVSDTTLSPLDTINENFKSLHQSLTTMIKNTKSLQDELKLIQKGLKQNDKINKHRKKKPAVKLSLSNELRNFLSVDGETKLTKAEVMKQVSTYIKDKHLQIQEDRRRFKPNKELSKIFGIKSTKASPVPNLTFVEINKYVSHHLSK